MRTLPLLLFAFLLCLAGPPAALGCMCLSYPEPFCARDLDGLAAEEAVVFVGVVRSLEPESYDALYQQVIGLMPEEHRQLFVSRQPASKTELSEEAESAFLDAWRRTALALYADRLSQQQLDALRRAETDEQVEDALDLAELGQSVQFELRESFSGELSESVEVMTGFGGGDCGFYFEKGETYLVEARKSEDGRLHAWICSTLVSHIDDAEADLAVLRAWKRGEPRPFLIYGRLYDSTQSRVSVFEIPPASGVPLRLVGGDEPREVSTDESGRFLFGDLSERPYRLELGLPGWRFSKAPGSDGEIDLTTTGCVELFLTIEKDED